MVKVPGETQAAQDWPQCNPPVGDNAKRIPAGFQGLKGRKHIGIDLPARMFVKFSSDGLRELIQAGGVLVLQKIGPRNHYKLRPEFLFYPPPCRTAGDWR